MVGRSTNPVLHRHRRNQRRNRTNRLHLRMDRRSSPCVQFVASEVEGLLALTGRSRSIMVSASPERMEMAPGMIREGHLDMAIVHGRLAARPVRRVVEAGERAPAIIPAEPVASRGPRKLRPAEPDV